MCLDEDAYGADDAADAAIDAELEVGLVFFAVIKVTEVLPLS